MTGIYASVDMGGTKIACALANGDGQVIAHKTIPTHSHQGPEAVLDRIGRLVLDLAEQADQRPAAQDMGVPGQADLRQSMVKFLPNQAGM